MGSLEALHSERQKADWWEPGAGGGRVGSGVWGQGLSLGKLELFRGWTVGMAAQHVNALMPLNGTLKNGNMVKCIPCVFYHNRKKIPCGKILLKQNKQKNKTKQKNKPNAPSDTHLIKSMSILCFFQEIPSSHFRASCPPHPHPRSFGFWWASGMIKCLLLLGLTSLCL